MTQWMERIKTSLGEITGLASLLIGFGMGVTGVSPTPWPQTTAVVLMVLSVVFLAKQGWNRITHKSDLLIAGDIRRLAWSEQFADPFRSRNRIPYSLPLTRRRMEAMILGLMFLGTLSLAMTKFPSMLVEINPAIATGEWKASCEGDGAPQSLLIVVAGFFETDTPLLFEQRLYDQLTSRSRWLGHIRVCQSEQVIKNRSEAIAFGEQTKASIVIWGRSDPSVYEVNIEVAEWDLPQYDLRSFPTVEAKTSAFQATEPLRTSFLAEYVLSQILYLRGDVTGARELLAAALEPEQIDSLKAKPENKKDLAEAFLLLGYFYDRLGSPEPDLDLAIDYYSYALTIDDTSYSVYLNRGQAYRSMGQSEKAIQDFDAAVTLTRDSRPDLASAALVNIAWIYVDKDTTRANEFFEQAIALDPVLGHTQRGQARLSAWKEPGLAAQDFEEALKSNTSDPYLYHFLGQAQVLNNEPQAAIQTYQDAISTATWEAGDRDIMIEDLRGLEEAYPQTSQTVNRIIKMLQSAG
jgi:tetratricopeptide (TPR) repeat protein